MAEQVQKKKPAPQKTTPTQEPAKTKDATELKAELDDLLDAVDEVLEENAETFVREYRQKGGE